MDPEALLSHRDFVRTLARQLVAAEAEADDVEQQTWLQALQRSGAVHAPRPWLAACVRNLARRRFRDSERRTRRERGAAIGESVPSVEDVRDLEARRRAVVDAVLELDEPFRACVLLRYFSDVPPREIARRLDVPLETVKSRLKRGLRRLRDRLDADLADDRRSLHAALLPLASFDRVTAGGLTLASGAMMMKSASWIGAAAALALAAVWMIRTGPSEPTPVPPEADAVHAATEVEKAAASSTRTAAGAPPSVDAPPAAVATAPTAPDPTGTVALGGVVLLPTGEPAQDARVSLIRNETDRFRRALPGRERTVVAERETGPDGEFSFAVLPGAPFRVVVEKEGFARRELIHQFGGDRVTVRLVPGATVFGRVTREKDGTPIAACPLRGFRVGEGVTLFRGETDAAGRYRFDDLEPGEFVIELNPIGVIPPGWTEVHLGAGERVERHFALLEGSVLRGRVTDRVTGAPIAGARIGDGWVMDRCVTSGPDGRYEYPGFGSPGTSSIGVAADGYGYRTFPSPLRNAARRAEYEIDFELTPTRTARGRVVAPNGEPAAGALVLAESTLGTPARSSVETDQAGVFHVTGIHADAPHTLYVRHPDYAEVTYELPSRGYDGGMVDLGDIPLVPSITLTGGVADERGRPIPSAELQLLAAFLDRRRLLTDDDHETLDPHKHGERRHVRTDGQGRFRIEQLAPGPATVIASGPGGTSSGFRELTLDAGRPEHELELTVHIGHLIRGTVLQPDSTPTSMAVVGATLETDPDSTRHAGVASDGSFTIAGLEPGSYRVVAQAARWANEDSYSPYFLPAEKRGVLAGTDDVRLVLRPGAPISGTAYGRDGQPFAHARIFALDADGATAGETQAEADGSFELVVATQREYTLRAVADDESDDAPVTIHGVRAGSAGVEVRPRD